MKFWAKINIREENFQENIKIILKKFWKMFETFGRDEKIMEILRKLLIKKNLKEFSTILHKN